MSKRRTILGATSLVVVLVGAVATWAQQESPPNKLPELSIEDYIEIQQLVARYPYPLDTNPDYGKSYAAQFTEDGIFHNQADHYYRGHADIESAANLNKRPPTPNNVGHFIFSHVIRPTANNGAVGNEQNFLISETGEVIDGRRASSITSYQYVDIYEKTSAGWKFKVRSHPWPGAEPPEREGDRWRIRPLSRP